MTTTDHPQSPPTRTKLHAPDFIRVIALLLVILLHVSGDYASAYGMQDPGQVWVGNLIHTPTRISVPLFFMLSGWLLLRKREETYLDFFRKRLWRIVPPFLFYAGIFYLWRIFYIGEEIGLWRILSDLGNFRLHTHFWFVYTILGLYLLTPILRELVHKGSKHIQAYILALWLINMTLLPSLDQFFGLEITLPYVIQIGGFVGYFLLGYMLSEIKLTPQHKRWAWITLISSLAVSVVGTHLLTNARGQFFDYFYDYLNPTVFLASAAAFLLMKEIDYQHWYQKRPLMGKLITSVGSLGYGIYLLHPLMIAVLEKGALGFQVSHKLYPPWIGIPILFGFSSLTSALIVWILSKIPGIKHFAT